MKVISPVIFGRTSSLQIVCHVLADCDREYQSHAYPEGSIQIWIWPYVRYKIIVATVWYHGSFEPLQNVVCIDIKEFLVILNCPEVVLGGT